MGLLNFSHREVTRALTNKVRLSFRGGKERNAWYELDGVARLRVTAPKSHRGGVTPGTLKQIRNDLRLSTSQLGDLIRCPLSGRDYEQLVRQKIEEGQL